MAREDPLADPTPLIRRVYAYVAYRIGDGPDAEDVTSEVFERALKYRSSYDPTRGRQKVTANTERVKIYAVVQSNDFSFGAGCTRKNPASRKGKRLTCASNFIIGVDYSSVGFLIGVDIPATGAI